MNRSMKIIALLLAALLAAAAAVSCTGPGSSDPTEAPDSPDASAQPAENTDAAASEEIVGKVNGVPIYSNDFYYFLYQTFREMYFSAEGLYDDELSEEENLARMKEYFYGEDEDGVKILSKAVDRTLEISAGFKIAYQLGMEAAETHGDKYSVSEETLQQMYEYIDGEADYGASVYGTTRDDFFFYVYGMNVNEAKRYTEQQLYAELHETFWSDENGYSFNKEMPEEPTAPADDASEEEKTAYETALAEYGTKLSEFEALKAAHYEKFRPEYEKDKSAYTIKTIRYMLLSKTDEEGNPLDEETVNAKREQAASYVDLVVGGHSFEGIVKGFSESDSVSVDYGLADVNFYSENINSVPAKLIDWAVETGELSEKPEIVESDDAIFLVMLCGITDFDTSEGIVSDNTSSNVEAVRASVEYDFLAREYNEFIEAKMKEDKYAVTDTNRGLMEDLAARYLEYSAAENGIEE